ncbi:MAG TPA: hypothetical protein VJK52_05365 [Candidatus Nanoarchaeia archaeon]|nr:hypothetical protein [Candidatus Nanoarchaeia archaeon]
MGKFQHSHTAFDNLRKGFPKELAGRVKSVAEELIKEQILFTKPTKYGLEISINPERSDRIMHYISAFLETA